MKKVITEIIDNLNRGKYINEAAVSNGIITRILQELNWPVYDPTIVIPEYSVKNLRVDYALCHPIEKPIVFIEVKQVDKMEGAERQLFEYAFHLGVPMAILTDGARWQFFLPAEQGEYTERRLYNLDLLQREPSEVLSRFDRYLKYENICNGEALDNARKDYRSVAKDRLIKSTLPNALQNLIEEEDELFIDLIVEEVEQLCGYSPEKSLVTDFLKNNVQVLNQEKIEIKRKIPKVSKTKTTNLAEYKAQSDEQKSCVGFILKEKKHTVNGAKDFCIKGLLALAEITDDFFARFAALPKHGRKRRFIAPLKYDLYPGRPDIAERASYKIANGYWLGVNIGQLQAEKILKLGCQIAGVDFGKDFKMIYE